MNNILHPRERKKYEQERDSIRRNLEAMKKSEYHMVRNMDRKHMVERLRAVEKILNEGTPADLRTYELNNLNNRRKELMEKIKEGMPTRDEMQVANGENVRKQVEWTKRTKGLIREYQNICRILDMEDEQLDSIENLRATA